MKKNTIPHVLSFLIFFGILIAFALITVLAPKKEFSDTENRNLAAMPDFSAENIASRKYMKGLETFLSDHFVSRSDWIGVKTRLELAEGKREGNGVYILKERLAEKVVDPSADAQRNIDLNLEAINHFAADTGLSTYLMVAPTSASIYWDELPANAPSLDQKRFIQECYGKLSGVTPLDVYDALYAQRDEYLYYRSDHHWTSLGAYYAYQASGRKLGFTAVPWDQFDIEHASSSFRGTLFSKVVYDAYPPDTIDLYTRPEGPAVTSVEIITRLDQPAQVYPSLFFREYLEQKDQYSVFCGNNQPIVTVKTDAKNAKKLLMFKDSYAHCFVPFLAQHYSEITMVDLRYINIPYREYLDLQEYDQCMFLYNCSTFVSDTNIKKLDL